jgi:hypothetical protein
MRKFIQAITVISLLFVTACGGREARPVNAVTAADAGMSCQQIELELTSNGNQIKTLIQEHGDNVGQNVGIGALSVLLFPPALFALDLKGAAKEEANALIARNRHLVNVAKSKGFKFNNIDLESATRDFSLDNGKFEKTVKSNGQGSA